MIGGGGLFFVVSSVVGVRLLMLARRNRTFPEFALGFAFVVGGTLSGALGQFVQQGGESLSPASLGQITFVYSAFSLVGITAYNIFTWRVFRPKSAGAAGLVALVFIVGLGLLGWYGSTGVFAGGTQSAAQRAAQVACFTLGPLWATIEAFRYYGLLRRRLALGIGDAIVADRIRLWGIGGAFATIIVLGSIVLIVVEPGHPLALISAANLGVCGTLASIAYALAFFPPSRYLDRVRNRAIAMATAG